MTHIVEVTAVRTGGKIPLGLLTIRQALNMPESDELQFRRPDDKKPLTREDLAAIAKN